MTIASTEKFLQAAIAEDGQPVSAGGPPLRSLSNGKLQTNSNGELARETIQLVKIQIPDKKASAQALVAMSRRNRVDCYANDVYVVPEQVLAMLSELGIDYREFGQVSREENDRFYNDRI